ncbi:uncharacterized protein ASCRUDRAFT_8942 [Ascoidea rubescens DSM 1968]|uniref:Uncharacterized protein n=1 Tax=Ascoidea rubescens DSM 1968 TaxID=1344418 RepID=A0A1D2VEY8_9ASCO|nr:hypothetical protein ASCRUDRAFT_8942 [Ascoidea rubescens DSM 1968]ODV60185.1 hypothetical protein ASCRUDRAFT_8942 [Ascoidea rubescens DSM 1968]
MKLSLCFSIILLIPLVFSLPFIEEEQVSKKLLGRSLDSPHIEDLAEFGSSKPFSNMGYFHLKAEKKGSNCTYSDKCIEYSEQLLLSNCSGFLSDDSELTKFYTCACALSDAYWKANYRCFYCVDTVHEETLNIIKNELCMDYTNNTDAKNSTFTDATLCNRLTNACYQLEGLAAFKCDSYFSDNDYYECLCALSNEEYWNSEFECYLCSAKYLAHQVDLYKKDVCISFNIKSTNPTNSSVSSTILLPTVSESKLQSESESESSSNTGFSSSSTSNSAANFSATSLPFFLYVFLLFRVVLLNIL